MKLFLYKVPSKKNYKNSFDSRSILAALSEKMMKRYDIRSAIYKLRWDGFSYEEKNLPGLLALIERVRATREELLSRYTLDGLLEDIDRKIFEVYKKSEKIKEYELILEEFRFNSLKSLKRRLKEIYFGKDRPNHINIYFHLYRIFFDLSPISPLFRLKAENSFNLEFSDCLKDITNILQKDEKEKISEFISKFSHILTPFSDFYLWLRGAWVRKVALSSISMSIEDERSKEFLDMEEVFFQEKDILDEFWRMLKKIFPQYFPKRYKLFGKESLNIYQAISLFEKLIKLDDLERSIIRANLYGNLDEIEKDTLSEFFGDELKDSLKILSNVEDILEREGYIEREDGKIKLTPKALRKIGEITLFALTSKIGLFTFKKRANLSSPVLTDETKSYEFGDPLNIHITKSLLNSIVKKPTFPPKIDPFEFEVYKKEKISGTSVVILLDLSSSMEDKLIFAKRVALALKELILRYFPKDKLTLVGFYTLARVIPLDKLDELKVYPFSPGRSVFEIPLAQLLEMENEGWREGLSDFTNIQRGLWLSRMLLSKDRDRAKHIFLITDGEPTAAFDENMIFYLSCPPTPFIFENTIKEAKKCAKSGIKLTTFMLSFDESLKGFLNDMSKIAGGKSLFINPKELGEYLIRDYLCEKS